ncbi:MAG TPA: hypothetical protein PLO33_14575 [Kouleothrix sp.]|uniref:hypothetical protein n=1 Tax=Kouleothrix sp. TaxID=2779161 RepID=UPI002D16C94E|nr:hypothetical protein [Kouleothrix sp.]HRC76900.1 hypothetical protein [Kouleothrix sp.]
MRAQRTSVFSRPRSRTLISVAVIALGLAIAVFFGLRSISSVRQLNYIREQGLDRGTASVDAIRGWMNIRFIAVAYAVPEEYLYSQLNIPFDQRSAERSLMDLNKDFKLGDSPNGRYPAIIDTVRNAVTAYRANPVATGLRDVRPWMSVRYIANSMGVPEARIFAALNIASAGNENKPLDMLSNDLHYPGGPRALVDAVKQALVQPGSTQ